MTEEVETPIRQKKIGRDYQIDTIVLVDVFVELEDEFLKSLRGGEIEGSENNISGLGNALIEEWKFGQDINVPFSSFPRIVRGTMEYHRQYKQLGFLYFGRKSTQYDLIGSSSELIIPRGTEIIDLVVPQIMFSRRKQAVTPDKMTESLQMVANYISLANLDGKFIAGLTHPRMGSIAQKRFGFSLEEHPFPPEIYKFLDIALKDSRTGLFAISAVERFRDQVLAYQTREDFLKRATIAHF